MAFKMKGHTLPGIKQKSEGNTDLKDGRSGSAVFQHGVNLSVEEHEEFHDDEQKRKLVKETFTKPLGEGSPKYKSAFQHRVDDVPSHQDEYGEEHYEDLQTDEEHKNGTRTHFPDGTKRSEREIAEYDENKAEEEKEKPAKNK